jgi:hypothetical protein
MRWLEDVEKDIREMKVKRWRPNGVDMGEWASEMKGDKALRGSKGRRLSK